MAASYETNTIKQDSEMYVMREPDYVDFTQHKIGGEDRVRCSYLMHYPTDTEPGHANLYERPDNPNATDSFNFGATPLYRQAKTFLHFSEGPGGVIAAAAGVRIADRSDTTPGGRRLELTYSSAEQTNEALADLGLPEGTFPTFVNQPGDQYGLIDSVRAIAKDQILLSTEGWGAAHDSFFHVPAWMLAAPELRAVFASRAQELVTAYDEIAGSFDISNERHRYIKQNLEGFGRDLDDIMNIWNFAEVVVAKLDLGYERTQVSRDRVNFSYGNWLDYAFRLCKMEMDDDLRSQQVTDLEAATLQHARAVLAAATRQTT